MPVRCNAVLLAATLAASLLSLTEAGHAQKTYTAEDYRLAERWMSYNTQPMVRHTVGGISYLPDGRVFYRDPDGKAVMYMIADPVKRTTAPAFDHAKLAAALGKGSRQTFDANHLGITSYTPEAEGFEVEARGTTFHCNAAGTVCKPEPPAQPKAQTPAQPASSQRDPGDRQCADEREPQRQHTHTGACHKTCGSTTGAARGWTQQVALRSFAGQDHGRLHPRLESLGAR